MTRTTAVLVIAKAPVAGRCKTRLCPPLSLEEAAALAEAALVDTVDAVSGADVNRRVLVLDGDPGPWVPDGFEVVAQRAGGFDERLAGAFSDTAAAGQHVLLIGMDTPQVTPDLLDDALAALDARDVDAVLGQAVDGGFWALGFCEARPEALLGVPMSTATTGAVQRARVIALGLRVADLGVLRDVDTIDDARAVAAGAPGTAFAHRLARLAPAAA